MPSPLAIAGIVVLIILVIGGITVAVLYFLGILKFTNTTAPAVAPVAQPPVATSLIAAPRPPVITAPPTTPPATPPTTPPPATPPPPAPAPTPATPPPPPPPAVPPPLTASSFIDRGCWRDGGFEFAYMDYSFNYNDPVNRAINITGVELTIDATKAPLLNDTVALKGYAIQKAIEGGFDTVGIQGTALWFGNYGQFINGVMYKYDKFGPVPTTSTCNLLGGNYVNRVYSTVAPNTTTLSASTFVDRGCWIDQRPRTIAKTWIDMRETGQPRYNWYNYALDRAVTGGFDTFGFQSDFALFLGNYTPEYRYDKLGSVSATATPCAEFGPASGWINRVYSTKPPGLITPTARLPGNTATASLVPRASDWLRKK